MPRLPNGIHVPNATFQAIFDVRRRVSAAPAFVPSDLPNLAYWYRRGTGITLNGSNVSAWNDQSGNARHLSQGTATNQPAWLASGGPGGGSYIDFDGVDDFLSGSGFALSGAMTFVAVIKADAISGNANGVFEHSNGATHFDFELINYPGYTTYNFAANYTGDTLVGFNGLNTSNYDAFVVTYNGSGSSTPANYGITVDGAAKTVIFSGTVASFSSGFVLGRRLDTPGTNYFNGQVVEIFGYSDLKSGADLANIVAYANTLI